MSVGAIIIIIIDAVFGFYMTFNLVRVYRKEHKTKMGLYAALMTDIFCLMNILGLIFT